MKAAEAFERLVEPLVKEGKVYASRCCGRVYLGKEPATSCRTCDKIPTVTEVDSMKAALLFAVLEIPEEG